MDMLPWTKRVHGQRIRRQHSVCLEWTRCATVSGGHQGTMPISKRDRHRIDDSFVANNPITPVDPTGHGWSARRIAPLSAPTATILRRTGCMGRTVWRWRPMARGWLCRWSPAAGRSSAPRCTPPTRSTHSRRRTRPPTRHRAARRRRGRRAHDGGQGRRRSQDDHADDEADANPCPVQE